MEDAKDAVRAFITEPALQQRLAKFLAHECFRNSELENLHTGVVPDSKNRRLLRRYRQDTIRRDSVA